MKYFLIILALFSFSCSELCEENATGSETESCAESEEEEDSFYWDEEEDGAWEDDEEISAYEDKEEDGWLVNFIVWIFDDEEDEEYEPYEDHSRCTVYRSEEPCMTKRDAKSMIAFDIGRNAKHQPIAIEIFKGDFEKGFSVAKLDDFDGKEIGVPVGELSATATYVVGKDTIVAVDGATLNYRYIDYCDRRCYEVEGVIFELALDEKLIQTLE